MLSANLVTARAASAATASVSKPDITPGLSHAVRIGPARPGRLMTVTVSLALRNEPRLQAFIARVSDPRSRAHGQYLTPAQFSALYGPTPGQVQQVADHLRASGLRVMSVSPNRTLVQARGAVSAVEAAFGVTISDWHDREQNRDFFGNDTQPTLPASLVPLVVGVAGLNNHYQRHRTSREPVSLPSSAGPGGGYTPTDLRSAFDTGPLETSLVPGSGPALGLFELDTFNQANISMYDANYGLLAVPPNVVTVDSGPTPNGGEVEVELDIEVMHALAPSSPITVWEGPNTDDGALNTYNAMVVSDSTPSNSTSWGICEPNTTAAEMTALDNVFKQAAAQGQRFLAASGDFGAYDCAANKTNASLIAVDSPAGDPTIPGVAGSALTAASSGAYGSEVAWSNTTRTPNLGSGGGLSTQFSIPSWQTRPGVQNSYSNRKPQGPDAALDADPRTGYSVYVTDSAGTGWRQYGGTSAGAPAWAAITALANQYANSQHEPNLGFANPTPYRLGSSQPPYPAFHDVTSGGNLYYPATSGWDFATGWGSVDAYNVARDLVMKPGPPRLAQHSSTLAGPRTPPPVVPQSK